MIINSTVESFLFLYYNIIKKVNFIKGGIQMGMYDYLGGEQVKIFYVPIFVEKDYIDQKPTIYHSGGSLRSFKKGEELPLKTLYYKYPQNFIIYDPRWSLNDVKKAHLEHEISANLWVIKNGTLQNLKWSKYVNVNDLGESVYDYYGRELNINKITDFEQMKIEMEQTYADCKRFEIELFPKGVAQTIKENIKEYEEKEPKLVEIRETTWGVFNKKWYKEDKYKLEKQFGEYLECLFFLTQRRNEEVLKTPEGQIIYDAQQDYLDCKNAFKEFIKSNEGISEKYINWLEIENMKQVAKNLVEELFSDID